MPGLHFFVHFLALGLRPQRCEHPPGLPPEPGSPSAEATSHLSPEDERTTAHLLHVLTSSDPHYSFRFQHFCSRAGPAKSGIYFELRVPRARWSDS